MTRYYVTTTNDVRSAADAEGKPLGTVYEASSIMAAMQMAHDGEIVDCFNLDEFIAAHLDQQVGVVGLKITQDLAGRNTYTLALKSMSLTNNGIPHTLGTLFRDPDELRIRADGQDWAVKATLARSYLKYPHHCTIEEIR